VRRLAASLALVTFLAAPAAAFAHATLIKTTPSFRQRVERSPTAIVLRFDQHVKVFPDYIKVLSATGRIVSGPTRTLADTRVVVAGLRKNLPRGPYTVRWRAISADGHVAAGVYTFGVRYDAPPPTEAYGASGPTTSEHIVRWLYFLSLAVVLGALVFRLVIVRGPLPRSLESRFYLIAGLGATGVLEVGIVAFLLRAEDALQLPFTGFLYGDLSPVASGTRFGTAFIAMTLGFALVTALVYLAWLTEETRVLWPALVIGLLFASGLSLSGHSAADAGHSWKSELADWVHLSAASIWLGGLVQLAFAVWPMAPELRREAFVRFSRLATVLVALILSAGIYLSVLRLPHVHDLWTAGYGRILLVKLSLVATALAWGAVHQFVAKPALDRAGADGVLSRLSRSLLGESAVGMAVLLVAAVLVDSKPPSLSSPATARAGQSPARPTPDAAGRQDAAPAPLVRTSRTVLRVAGAPSFATGARGDRGSARQAASVRP
jgi:copper transport protein